MKRTTSLFVPLREGYVSLNGKLRMENGQCPDTETNYQLSTLNSQLQAHPDLVAFTEGLENHFQAWADKQRTELRALAQGFTPKTFINEFSEDLL